MAWNPRSVLVALLVAAFVGCFGCEPDKKSAVLAKQKATHEAVPSDSTSSSDEEAAAKPKEVVPAVEHEAPPAKTPEETAAPKATETSVKDETPPAVPAPKPAAPLKAKPVKKAEIPPPATMPKVSLTDKLRATCLVKVGDELPEVELAGIDGSKVAINSLFGEALTVVFFWNAGTTTYSQQSIIEALGDMQKDFSEPFAAKGLKVVGVNVGNLPDDVKTVQKTSGVTFPNLIDSRGDFFKSVATEKLPRVYLLDGAGKILWFDVEFTRATRRELTTGIKAVLEGKK
jgi:peroxiredoxin